MATLTKQVEVNQCERCGHEWQRRRKRRPKVCPICKSRDWNKPKPAPIARPEQVTA